jgi:N-acetylmuramoyl-L-alanine amidase
MRKLKSIVLSALIVVAWAGAAYGQAMPTDAQRYEKGRECYKSGERQRCIEIFDSIARQPNSPYADKAAYSAARLSRELYSKTRNKADMNSALMQYNRVVRDHPDSSLADDALYQIARIRAYQTGEKDRAKKALKVVIERYPNGDAAPDAKQLLAKLEGRATEPEKKQVVEIVEVEEVAEYTTVAEDEPVGFSGQPASAEQPGVLVDVQHRRKGEETIITLKFDRPVRYSAVYKSGKQDPGSNPSLDVVLKETYSRKGLPGRIEVGSMLVRRVNIGPRLLGGTKVNINLDGRADYELTAHSNSLDLTFKPGAGAEIKSTVAPVAAVKPQAQPKEESPSLWSRITGIFSRGSSEESGPRPMRIVLDPGHGGEEDGAIGPHGIREKDVTLEIAKKLKVNLENSLGAKVWLTRTRDKTLSLKKRNKIAKRRKADFFISIHANASTDPEHRGMETYFLNNASDEAALRLAARENDSWKGPTSDIDGVLSTMLQNAVTDESRELATLVQTSMVKTLSDRYENVRNRGVRSALFYVLVGTKSPGILVETSFITNPREEMRLVDPTYQEQVAASITQGVKNYVAKDPTRFSSL